MLFGRVTETALRASCAGLRSIPLALDLKAAALAAIAAVLAFGLHRGLIEVIVAMAALGIAMQLLV